MQLCRTVRTFNLSWGPHDQKSVARVVANYAGGKHWNKPQWIFRILTRSGELHILAPSAELNILCRVSELHILCRTAELVILCRTVGVVILCRTVGVDILCRIAELTSCVG